jgi:hypothetical protein
MIMTDRDRRGLTFDIFSHFLNNKIQNNANAMYENLATLSHNNNVFFYIFGLMPLFLFFNTKTLHIKSILHNCIAMPS